jgi:hypothetical protein
MPWGGAAVPSALDEGVEPGDKSAHVLVQGALALEEEGLAVEARSWQMDCSL